MKKILIMDAHNYDDNYEEIMRISIRGIIFVDGRLLMIEDSAGEVKLPGGGMESGEDDYQALIREVKEETGYDSGQGQCGYSENEQKYGFHPVFYTIEEALEKNERMMENEGRKAWTQREYKTLLLIKKCFR